jgi:nicotinate-nucleotide adenylyltransferase
MSSCRDLAASKFHAILGGSFDPVHNGHLNIARHLLALDHVEGVVFIPVRNHNFKGNSIILDWESRYALLQRVMEPGMQVWDSDACGSGYTCDLMQDLSVKHPGTRFMFVIGSDNISSLPKWHNAEWLMRNVCFLAVQRPGFPVPEKLPQGFDIQFAEVPALDVSSTCIRDRVLHGESIWGLVPESILAEVERLYPKEKGS